MEKVKIAVCLIAKGENEYINEGCHWYLDNGFCHIYIYDNNNFTDPFIGDFIDKELLDRITIFDWRERKNNKTIPPVQLEAYVDCHKNQAVDMDWLCFFDADEFLADPKAFVNYLSTATNIPAATGVKSVLFGDEDCVNRDRSIHITKFFKTVVPYKAEMGNAVDHFKPVVNMHDESIELYKSNPIAYGYRPTALLPNDLVLNHYHTRTLSEFIDHKLLRGNQIDLTGNFDMSYYGLFNKKTPEKIAYVKEGVKNYKNKTSK